MEEQKIEAWMFRSPNEYWALLLSLLLIITLGYVFSYLNLYLFLGGVFVYIIWVKLQQLSFLGNAIRVHKNQYPEIYEMFRKHALKLQIHKAALYIKQDPYLNASTIGLSTCTVVLNSALVEQLSNDELNFILGHELGHYKAGHTKITSFLFPLGNGNLISNFLFGFWHREAEYTADRCGIALTKNFDASITSLIKITLGGTIYDKFDIQGYMAQFKKAHNSNMKISEVLTFSTHPYLSNRIRNVIIFWKEAFKKRNEV